MQLDVLLTTERNQKSSFTTISFLSPTVIFSTVQHHKLVITSIEVKMCPQFESELCSIFSKIYDHHTQGHNHMVVYIIIQDKTTICTLFIFWQEHLAVTLTLPYVLVAWSFHESSCFYFLYSLNFQLEKPSSCLLCFVWIPEINKFLIH